MSSPISDREPELVPLESLRPHERILPDRLQAVMSTIEEENIVDYPILIDSEFGVILDGHHRYHALRELGVRLAPVVRVPYDRDDLIQLKTRPNSPSGELTKQEVLRMGLSEEVFPPKSTRHILTESLLPVDVPVSRLRSDDEAMT